LEVGRHGLKPYEWRSQESRVPTPKNSKAQCVVDNRTCSMTTAQKAAAKNNIKKAAAAAKKKKTIAHLPKATRTALGKKGAEAAQKKKSAGK
jgi:hypothetical protein